MIHNDDSFAAMLLTMSLSPDREELVYPLSTAEFYQLVENVRNSPLRRIRSLVGLDMSGVISALNIPEEEAYRLCMLASRSMPLSYALEKFERSSMEIVTVFDPEYPARLLQKLGHNAPPVIYYCGSLSDIEEPSVSIIGIGGVKLNPRTEDIIKKLVNEFHERGFRIVTGGEPGVCRIADAEASRIGGRLTTVLAGKLARRICEDPIAEMIAQGRATALTLVHPDAPFSVQHAIARSKLLFSLSQAAFILNTDGKRGESEALRNHYCEAIYAMDDPKSPANRLIIERGATPISDFNHLPIDKLIANWTMSQAEQLSFLE